ncbi:MAG: TIGR03087 family PEP-CTERM/XrtA system glycosyltransferase [Anaerolineae bacterium]
MRILCLTSRLPYPPNRGDRLRAFHFIEHLARHHELHLASFIAGDDERAHLPALREHCREVHVVRMTAAHSAVAVAGSVWRRQPLQALYYRSRAMRRLVARMAATTHFDAAYVHLFRMAPYAIGLSHLYRVVDLTDAISAEIERSLPYRGLASRLLYRIESPRIARYECWVARNFEETWLISEADRQILAGRCGEGNLRVVPNGVDLDEFHPAGRPPKPDNIILVGHMGVMHNVDAARYLATEVLPRVRQHVPRATLTLAGADPVPAVRQLGEVPGVEVTGFVEDLNACLNRASVFAAPLRFSAGVQNKVLEAMAAGRPVVTTSTVNHGLGAVPGRQLLVADDATTMAADIVALFRDPERRAALGRAGRHFVEEHYTWQHAVARMDAIERRLSSGFASPQNVL